MISDTFQIFVFFNPYLKYIKVLSKRFFLNLLIKNVKYIYPIYLQSPKGVSIIRPSVPSLHIPPSQKFQQAQSPPSQIPVIMIMSTLLSMVYGLFKLCRLTHDTRDITSLMLHVATCFKETVLLFNMHLKFFVVSILILSSLFLRYLTFFALPSRKPI